MPLKAKTEKQKITIWKALVKEIIDSTDIDTAELDEVIQQRKTHLEADPEAWFRYYFPRYAFAPPAQFHKDATSRVLQNTEWYEVRIWSRELAKSTRTMMEVLYLILVGHLHTEVATDGTITEVILKKRYVLLISNSEDNAIRLLMPYKANLEYNKRIIQDYGLQENNGNWQAGEFTTQQGVAFRAIGAGQSPRGARNEEVRPDIILFDDVDTDADCLNPEIIARKWHWIEEAAIGTRSVSQPTTIIFCGNRISADCCIERAAKLADHVVQVNIRDEQGHSTWPEKNSELAIDRVLAQKSYAAQQKEYFNNPLTEGSVFKEMAYKAAKPLHEYARLVCYTDPSYKATNDYKATVLVGRWKEEYHVIKCYLAQTTTAELINWHYQIMDLVKGYNCYFFIEDVFMQDVIMKEISDAGKRNGRIIPIKGDNRKKMDKFTRIESLLDPLNRNGQLYLNEAEKDNQNMERLAEQFMLFAPRSRGHDDGPDAVEGAVWKIDEMMGRETGIVTFGRTDRENRW
jgi:predicted phage terminase large subunit-like protein